VNATQTLSAALSALLLLAVGPATFAAPPISTQGASAPSASTQGAPAATAPASDGILDEIRHRLESQPPQNKVAGRDIKGEELRAFYRDRGFRPVWVADGKLNERGEALLKGLTTAGEEGLNPNAYHVTAIVEQRKLTGNGALAELDLLLSDGLLRYAQDMQEGRVDPSQFDTDWKLPRPQVSGGATLHAAAADGPIASAEIASLLKGLQPPYPQYQALKTILADYRDIASTGGWPAIPQVSATLRPGDSDDRIPTARLRLMITGELPIGDATSLVLDDELATALKKFQASHGLTEDGTLGRQTISALNITANARVGQILANMERWRMVPRHLESSRIMVNIPGASFELYENDTMTMAMRVVVGSPNTPTPVMRGAISSLTVNPTWTLPASIVKREILPKLKKDPSYLVANNIRIVGSFPPDSLEAQGIGIAWDKYNSLPYTLRQMPGDKNALGHLKFNMPNRDDIYLHDTPSHGFFSHAIRTLSHGCVRLEEPKRLAAHLLDTVNGIPADKLDGMLDSGQTQTVVFHHTLPVYLLYWTAWTAPDGTAQFREDIYGHDNLLLNGLKGEARPQVAAK